MSTSDRSGAASDRTPKPFGRELRRRRIAARLSLTAFAQKIHYSSALVSRVETGRRPPALAFARACESLLGGDGTLFELWSSDFGSKPAAPVEVDRLELPPVDFTWGGQLTDMSANPEIIAIHTAQLDHLRRLVRQSSGALVADQVDSGLRALLRYAAVQSGHRSGYLALAARYADLGGWLHQEGGRLEDALQATVDATRLASAAGEVSLLNFCRTRQAEVLIALARYSAAIQLTDAVAALPHLSARVRSVGAYRSAQAYAAMGRTAECRRALAAAERLLERSATAPAEQPFGGTSLSDPHSAVAGWCHFDLGQHDKAVEQLETALAGIDSGARRMRGVMSGRLASAHAAAGNRAEARAWGDETLRQVRHTDSASAVSQLRNLKPLIRRWGRDEHAVELEIALTGVV